MSGRSHHLRDRPARGHSIGVRSEANRTFTLTDGTSAHFEQHGGTLSQHGGTLSLTGTSRTPRDYEIIFRTAQTPTNVRLNGQPLPEFGKPVPGQPLAHWWWNPSSTEAHLLFHASDFRLELKDAAPTQYGGVPSKIK